MKKDGPAGFILYPSDLLGDPNVQKLSVAEFGATVRLILWSHSDTIDDNDLVLARVSGLHGRWKRHRAAIMACFIKGEDGKWRHPITIRSRANWEAKREKQSEGGKEGARRRWVNPKVTYRSTHSENIGNPCFSSSSSSSRSTPSAILTPGLDLNAPTQPAPEPEPDQDPVASDREPKVKIPDHHPEDLLPGDKRCSEFPWLPRRCQGVLVGPGKDEGERHAYFDRHGRVPEEPPPGWVNRTGKWEYLGVPEAVEVDS